MTLLPLLATISTATAGVVSPGAAPGLDAVYEPRRVAVVIGVQEYDDPKLQGLRFAAEDARDLAAVLGDPAHGGFDRVVVLEGHVRTTASAIRDAIRIATSDLQRDDTFLLYASGHGTLTVDAANGSRLFFLPSDGLLDEPERTGLPVAWLEQAVNEVPARRRVLVLDTCHNGRSNSKSALNDPTARVIESMRGEPPAPRSLREVSESEARLYAAQFYQPAMEDGELGNGVYTHYLVEALTAQSGAADLDRDGLVDVTEAHDYARDRTIRRTGGMQVPRAEYRIVGREEVYLSGDPSKRTTAEQALLSACDEVLARARLLVDGMPRGELPGLVAVEPGRHRVEVQALDGRILAGDTIDLDAGATVPVESLFARRDGARVMALAGASARTGPGAESVHPLAAEVELTWVRPLEDAAWLRPDVHLRGAWMRGPIDDPADAGGPVEVAGGDVALGAGLGIGGPSLAIGPVLEGVVPWRSFERDGAAVRQADLTAAAGGRLLGMVPVGPVDLVVRLDTRFVPLRYDADWTAMWHHGIAVGVSSGR